MMVKGEVVDKIYLDWWGGCKKAGLVCVCKGIEIWFGGYEASAVMRIPSIYIYRAGGE